MSELACQVQYGGLATVRVEIDVPPTPPDPNRPPPIPKTPPAPTTPTDEPHRSPSTIRLPNPSRDLRTPSSTDDCDGGRPAVCASGRMTADWSHLGAGGDGSPSWCHRSLSRPLSVYGGDLLRHLHITVGDFPADVVASQFARHLSIAIHTSGW